MRKLLSPVNGHGYHVCVFMSVVSVDGCQCVGVNALHTNEATMWLHLLFLPPEVAREFPLLSSVHSLSRVDSLRSHGLQQARPPCPSPTPGAHSNSCPLSQ